MFGKINQISNNLAYVENIATGPSVSDLMNTHVVFEAENQKILGEVQEVDADKIVIRFLGEYIDGRYISGVIRKPKLSSTIRVINKDELETLVGTNDDKSFIIGNSSIYRDYTVCADINQFFSNHLAIFGNSGAGKSCGVARIVQNIFKNPNRLSYNANIFIFDAYGEYKNAFTVINQYNQNYNYKFITTNPTDKDDFLLQIPLFLFNIDDMALLLQASEHSQLPIIERTLRLCKIFAQHDEASEKYQDHLIAKALLAVLFSNQTTASKKNEIFTILEACTTKDFSFNSVIQGLGYTRVLSECFEIDSNGNFGESVLITDYILKHINEELENTKEPAISFYGIRDFQKALEFTLISEGFQNNTKVADDATILKVRINSIINSKVSSYFNFEKFMTIEQYISSLIVKNGRKSQIININLEDIDDVYAKVIVKVFSRWLFDFSKTRKERATVPFHLFLEEAHRYIQKDNDTFLLGYNIFDRIAKEGRKYGVLLDIISQRPVEISDTVIAQVSNFLIFKMTHPLDIEYIEKMLPNISSDVIEKMKSLQPGNCVGFGTAFKLPMIMKLEMPNPMPYSTNCDVNNCWKVTATASAQTTTNPAPQTQPVNPINNVA